jgi:predicted RNA methylase
MATADPPQERRPALAERVAYRLLRLEDRRYERRAGIDAAAAVPLDALTIPYATRESGFAYVASPTRLVRRMISSLPARLGDLTFIDMGSGKGRVVCYAAAFPFERVIGVEFAGELHAEATANVSRLRAHGRALPPIDLVHMDAGAYELPAADCVLYFNNPFGSAVMERVLTNVEATIDRGHRVFALYQQARHEDDATDNVDRLRASPFLRERSVEGGNPLDRFLLGAYVPVMFESVGSQPGR